jgi:hypothetical protein
MRKLSTRSVAMLAAAVALLAMASWANANRLSVSSSTVRAVWTPISFTASGASTVRCNVTLEGSFHSRTITKTIGSLIGYITNARFSRPCTGGTLWAYNGTEVNEVLGGTLATSLPWHITFEGFNGALPNITGVRLLFLNVRFLYRATLFGIPALCNYRSEAGNNIEGIAELSGATVSGLRANEERGLRSESGGVCPTVRFSGTASVTSGGGALTITLI